MGANSIIGLDLAQLGFIGMPKKRVLNSSDADIVDVIHTDINMRGLFYPIGHVDFYANSGYSQPCCLLLDAMSLSLIYSCSHDRAPMFYAESNNSKIGFWGSACPQLYMYLGMCTVSDDNLELFGINSSVRLCLFLYNLFNCLILIKVFSVLKECTF